MSLVCKKYALLAVDMILSATDILWEEKRKLSDCCICARYLYTTNSAPLCWGRNGGSILLDKHTVVIFSGLRHEISLSV